MIVAFNCWVLRNKNVDGIGNVVIETLRPMIKAYPHIKFLLLCDKHFVEDYFNFPNVVIHRIFPPYRHPVLYVFYLEWLLPRFLKKHKPDLFVGMDGMISLRTTTKQLAVIHDLNFEHFPGALPFRNRVYYRYFFKRFARRADRIAVVSGYTKADVVRLYKVPASKIDVITLGARKIFEPLSFAEIERVRKKYTDGAPYFFFVGSMHTRKNIQRLMQAFDLFKKETGSNFKLVLAGNILWNTTELESVHNQIACKDDIIFPGRVSDEELKCLLGAAYGLSFVPLFEGFGLPIVEAFQAGVPVICSNTSSMPEVAGDAALLVDPFNIEEIATAMKEIACNENLRKNLIQKGNKRKALFDWSKTADLLFEAIQKTNASPWSVLSPTSTIGR